VEEHLLCKQSISQAKSLSRLRLAESSVPLAAPILLQDNSNQLLVPMCGRQSCVHLKTFIVGHENSEYGVEWMRFEADAPIPELVRQVPHVAFEVSDLASELVGREILIAPNSPSDGVRVAFIVENGAPIELLEFTDPNHPDRR
jgi:hypothetical protein